MICAWLTNNWPNVADEIQVCGKIDVKTNDRTHDWGIVVACCARSIGKGGGRLVLFFTPPRADVQQVHPGWSRSGGSTYGKPAGLYDANRLSRGQPPQDPLLHHVRSQVNHHPRSKMNLIMGGFTVRKFRVIDCVNRFRGTPGITVTIRRIGASDCHA